MRRNRVKQAQRKFQNRETDLLCLKTELCKTLSDLEPIVQEYVIPEVFTRCHCQRSIRLLVEDKEIYASKQILKLASPVFLSMFESDFREKNMESIVLPGKTCREVVLLLSCLYPNILEQIEDDQFEHEKNFVEISSLSEAGRKAWANISHVLHGRTEVQVHNWFGTAKELRDVFRKLHVTSISINRKSGKGTVKFDDTESAMLAYCLDGQVFNTKALTVKLLPGFDSNNVEELFYSLSKDNGGAAEDTCLDSWQFRKIHLLAKEKLRILLRLADEYQMEAVLRLCEEKYLYWLTEQSKDNKEIPADKVLKLLHKAERYNLPNLHKEVSDRAVKTKLKIFCDQPLFKKLSTKTKFNICQSKLSKLGQSDGNLGKPDDNKTITESSDNNAVLPQKINNEAFINGTNPYMTMVIQVGSDKLYASREVLALSSQVLKDRMEANDDQKPLDFPDHDKDDFLCLLRSIHPNFEPTVNRNNVKRLLKLSEEFQLQKLYGECDDVLDSEFRDMDAKSSQAEIQFVGHGREFVPSARILTARQYLSLALQFKLPKLQESCCKAISSMRYQQLMPFIEENKESIPQDVLINIMYPRILMLERLVQEYRLKSLYSKESSETLSKTINFTPDPELLFREQSENDVCLVVQDKNLYIDEDVLSLASPFFKRELEKQNVQHCRVIVCKGKKIDGMISLLKCIHPNMLAKVNEANAMIILHFVEEYEMSALSKVCEDSPIKTCTEKMSAASMVDYITKAEKYKMHRLRLACESTLAKMCGESSSRYRTTISNSEFRQSFVQRPFYDNEYCPPSRYYSSDDSY